MRPGRDCAHHVLGADRAGGAVDLLPALQRREGRAFGDAEALRRLGVEAPGPLLLDQGVAVGAHAVLGFEGSTS